MVFSPIRSGVCMSNLWWIRPYISKGIHSNDEKKGASSSQVGTYKATFKRVLAITLCILRTCRGRGLTHSSRAKYKCMPFPLDELPYTIISASLYSYPFVYIVHWWTWKNYSWWRCRSDTVGDNDLGVLTSSSVERFYVAMDCNGDALDRKLEPHEEHYFHFDIVYQSATTATNQPPQNYCQTSSRRSSEVACTEKNAEDEMWRGFHFTFSPPQILRVRWETLLLWSKFVVVFEFAIGLLTCWR